VIVVYLDFTIGLNTDLYLNHLDLDFVQLSWDSVKLSLDSVKLSLDSELALDFAKQSL